ncbi:hypothetical protein PENTCL1PPCAC_6238, partial [Pristionchus entomophagus]
LQMSPRPARSRKTTARLQDSYVELKRLKVVTGDLPSSRNASHASPALMGTTGGEEHSGYSPIIVRWICNEDIHRSIGDIHRSIRRHTPEYCDPDRVPRFRKEEWMKYDEVVNEDDPRLDSNAIEGSHSYYRTILHARPSLGRFIVSWRVIDATFFDRMTRAARGGDMRVAASRRAERRLAEMKKTLSDGKPAGKSWYG